MNKLLKKSEISGTCWVEFNTAGDWRSFDFWHPESRYAALDSILTLQTVISEVVEGFDVYGINLLSRNQTAQLAARLIAYTEENPLNPACEFAKTLGIFMAECSERNRHVWVLGL